MRRCAAFFICLPFCIPAAAQNIDVPDGFLLKPLVLGISAGTKGIYRILPKSAGPLREFTVLEVERIDLWSTEANGSESEAFAQATALFVDTDTPTESENIEPPPLPPRRLPPSVAPPRNESDLPILVEKKGKWPTGVDEWLFDRLAGETTAAADLGLLLLDKESPFTDESFLDLQTDPKEIVSTLQLLMEAPEIFCDDPIDTYTPAGAARELDCNFRFGRFTSYLLLRLQKTEEGWFLVRARAANSQRYRQLREIANSLRP